MSHANRRSFLSGLANASALLPILALGGNPVDTHGLRDLDAVALASLIKKRRISPQELLDYTIDRIETLNPTINAIAHRYYDVAKATVAKGNLKGTFAGVPFLTKDLSFDVKGKPAEYGSRLFADHLPTVTSTIVKRLQQSGLILVGSTRVPELGLLPTTESIVGGVTKNPWKLSKTSGGSSGGSAAAVAAGIVPMAGASDGGGSIRIPASCCGLFGLKPTRGRTPVGPLVSETWGGLGVIHALTRTVRDSAALLDATSGPEHGAAYAVPPNTRSYLRETRSKTPSLRIALVTTMDPAPIPAEDCLKAVFHAGRLLQQLGHHVDDVTASFNNHFSFEELRTAHGKMVLVELRRKIDQRLRFLQRELKDSDLEPVTRFYYDVAADYTAVEIQACRNHFHNSSRIMAHFLHDYDVILTPTLASPPIDHREITLTGWAKDVADGLIAFNPCCALANWTGQPAMSIPYSTSKDGLPIGVQFFGRFADEALLFRLANQIEEARPWIHHFPVEPRE